MLDFCLLVWIGMAPAHAAADRILRWDYETGLQGWRKWSTVDMAQGARPGRAHSGLKALWGRVTERGPLVHLVDGLDFPLAGSTLRFWYYVPTNATFDHFEINVRTHEFGDGLFQLSSAIRKGVWTRVELPFTEFFGWAQRVFGSFTISEFEVTSVGTGEILLDDVAVLLDRTEAARCDRAPEFIWLPGQDASSVPGGTWGYFRKTFELPEGRHSGWLQVSGDNEATAWVNGVCLGKVGWSPATEFDLSGVLTAGRNVIALAVLNHGAAPNPACAVAVAGIDWGTLGSQLILSNGNWRASADAPDGWTGAEWDDRAWPLAQSGGKVPGPPWGIVDIYPLKAPEDRTVPGVQIEVSEGKLWAALDWRGRPARGAEYVATLRSLASNMTSRTLGRARGRVEAQQSRVELFSVEGLKGPHEVGITWRAGTGEGADRAAGRQVRTVFWAPGTPVGRRDRATQYRARGTGFFRTEEIGGRWWLVDPEGNLFLSLACNAIIRRADWSLQYHRTVAEHYLDPLSWAEFACQRLVDLGFNSLSGGDDALEPHRRRNVPYFGGSCLTWAGPWMKDAEGRSVCFPDVFDPEWRQGAEEWVREATEEARNDPLLIGYFTDNEINMHQPLSRSLGVMDHFWSPGAQGEFIRWLRERYSGDIRRLNASWTSTQHTYSYATFDGIPRDKPTIRVEDDPVAPDLREFCRHTIRSYCETVVGLYRRYDPNHLVCSNRFAGQFDTDFADLLRGYDLIACNSYPRAYWGQTRFDDGQLGWLRAMHEKTGRPIIISEWGVSARQSGYPNFWGRLDTETQRGEAYENIIRQHFGEPYLVGSHWFSWVDSTDGEAISCGIVNGLDQPYRPLTRAMRRANAWLTERVRTWQPGQAPDAGAVTPLSPDSQGSG